MARLTGLLVLLFSFVQLFAQKADQHLLDSLEQALQQTVVPEKKADLMNRLALEYYNQDLKKSLDYGQKAYDISNTISYQPGILKSLTILMRAQRRLGNFSVAIELNLKKLPVAEALNDTPEVMDSYASLGNISSSMGNFQESKRYLLKAYEVGKMIDAPSLASIMNYIGRNYVKIEKYDSGLFWISAAMEREKARPQDGYTLSYLYNNLAELYLAQKNYKKAIENYLISYQLPDEKKSNYGLTFTLIGLAQAYDGENRYKEAIRAINESLMISKKYAYREKTREAYGILHALYEKQGDYKSALQFYKLFNLYQDSIFSEDKLQYIENLKLTYETEKIANENQILKKDAELNESNLRQQKTFAWLVTIAAVSLFIGFIFLYQNNRQKKKTNLILAKFNEDLSQQVEERTQDLVKANFELIQQNNQLEQFGYITAHNLRAPVARLLGLANILNHPGFEMPRDKEVLDKLEFNAKELDTVIKDLNEILDIKKGHSSFQKVDIQERIEKVKRILKDRIAESNATIHVDLQVKEIHSVPAYMESIFYNLLSNAIKYRSPQRALELNVQTYLQDQKMILKISDNGLGIDVENLREKIFTLYQRFHDHVEGKGLGLFLVKTQVEALNGKIEIDSKVDEGTTFTVELPFRSA